ncbi:MAG: DUF4395 domain-containing protein [Coriobacteriia bacterium]|nr:DUF4395 domain-containing protein [Coriobacteriia bacterium]
MSTSCPINHTVVDSNAVRIVALFVVGIVAVFLLTGSPLVVLALTPDFLIRAAGRPRWSPLARVAMSIVRLLELAPRPIDSAPKRFAAGIGVAFTAAAGLLTLAGLGPAAAAVAAILLVCAALESLLGFCVGCRVHAFLPRSLVRAEAARQR